MKQNLLFLIAAIICCVQYTYAQTETWAKKKSLGYDIPSRYEHNTPGGNHTVNNFWEYTPATTTGKEAIYVYACARISGKNTYVYTPVITCWFNKDKISFYHASNIIKIELGNQLEKYIEGEMGYNYPKSYSYSSNQLKMVENWRLESIAESRKSGYGIEHTGSSFSYTYNEQ